MAIIRTGDARKLSEKDLDKKLSELKLELTKEKASISIGASATSPGRIKEIKRATARILTVKKEKQSSQGSEVKSK